MSHYHHDCNDNKRDLPPCGKLEQILQNYINVWFFLPGISSIPHHHWLLLLFVDYTQDTTPYYTILHLHRSLDNQLNVLYE